MARFIPDQKFIVTGASSGIGESVALRLVADGASVIAIARNVERLNALKEKACLPENLVLEIKDLAEDIENLPAYMKSLKDKYGKFCGCVCCAGITEVRPLRALDLVEMKRLFDINYYVPIFMAKGFADRRVNSGSGASFVSIASISYNRPAKAVITYSGSKAALVSSMVAIAKEFAPVGVRFNTVSPSDIETPMTQDIPEIMDQVRHFYPMDFGKPEDVSAVVSFLLSDEAKWITGQNYVVDCGSR
jgi:NAD(P)-dependent dehydrogenase (short-subunit alcohol dehydrogenase family)